MIFFYDFGLFFFACVKVLFNWKKYRGLFGARLGRNFPKIEKGKKTLVWVHAVSLGETRAITPLIQKLKERPNPPIILLSTITETGYEEGKKSQADHVVYLPFDFRFLIRPIVARVCPDLVILSETDFWYHFQAEAKKCGAKLLVVNGKLSERSFLRYKKFPSLVRHLLMPIDHFYLQGSNYTKRLEELGIPAEKITVTGNIKLDASIGVSKSPSRQQLGLAGQFVITLGSTHAPEERLWLHALKPLWQKHPEIKVIIVPRHPERFNEVAELLEEEQLSFARWSQKGTLHARDILLVDEIGVLKKCYSLSDLAFVGGSFTSKVGGHNILEPSMYGKPVLFGPYMHSQPDFLDLVRTYQAGLQILPEDIISTVNQCITSPLLARHLGENGLRLLSDSRGALDKTVDLLLPLLEKRES